MSYSSAHFWTTDSCQNNKKAKPLCEKIDENRSKVSTNKTQEELISSSNTTQNLDPKTPHCYSYQRQHICQKCTDLNLLYKGEEKSRLESEDNVQDPETCREMCDRNYWCNYYTWQDGTCQLWISVTSHLNHAQGAHSGNTLSQCKKRSDMDHCICSSIERLAFYDKDGQKFKPFSGKRCDPDEKCRSGSQVRRCFVCS